MEFEHKMYLSKLYDIYYEVFTKKQQQTFEYYFDDDYSVSEIAIKLKVSQANVSKTIKQVSLKLENLEKKLKIEQNYIHNTNLLIKEGIPQEVIKKLKK